MEAATTEAPVEGQEKLEGSEEPQDQTQLFSLDAGGDKPRKATLIIKAAKQEGVELNKGDKVMVRLECMVDEVTFKGDERIQKAEAFSLVIEDSDGKITASDEAEAVAATEEPEEPEEPVEGELVNDGEPEAAAVGGPPGGEDLDWD